MPATPRVFKASFTSSSLKGLRTATISFTTGSPFVLVALRPFPGGTLPDRRGRIGRHRWRGRAGPDSRHLEGAARPHGDGLLGEGLLVVDGEVADLEHVVGVARAPQHEPDDL